MASKPTTAQPKTAAKAKPKAKAKKKSRGATPRSAVNKLNTSRARAKFLETFRSTGNVSASCLAAGVGRTTPYLWRADNAFALAWDEAEEIACDGLELEARRRGVTGVEEPVYQGGEKVGTITRYSDRMLEILLKAHRPHKFRENHTVDVQGTQGAPIQSLITYRIAPEDLPIVESLQGA